MLEVDLDGTYPAWFDRLGARCVVICPDFHVAATAADPIALGGQVDVLLSMVCLTELTFDSTPVA